MKIHHPITGHDAEVNEAHARLLIDQSGWEAVDDDYQKKVEKEKVEEAPASMSRAEALKKSRKPRTSAKKEND